MLACHTADQSQLCSSQNSIEVEVGHVELGHIDFVHLGGLSGLPGMCFDQGSELVCV
jgi:hypothetical protein